MKRQARARGFSVTELMVVVAILGIVAAIAAPSMNDLLANQRVKSAAFAVVASTMTARSEAIKRGSATGVYLIAPSNNLNNGWCLSISATSVCNLAAPDMTATIRLQQPMTGVTFSFVPTSTAGPIKFNRAGRLDTAYQLQLSDNFNGTLQRCITIDVSGNAQSRAGACT